MKPFGRRSDAMEQLLELGFVFVKSIDSVVDLQEESILEGILIDYVVVPDVLRVDHHDKAYKVYQCGGF